MSKAMTVRFAALTFVVAGVSACDGDCGGACLAAVNDFANSYNTGYQEPYYGTGSSNCYDDACGSYGFPDYSTPTVSRQ